MAKHHEIQAETALVAVAVPLAGLKIAESIVGKSPDRAKLIH